MPLWPLTIVRGAPGLGKSTLAELLRLRLADGTVIDVDDLRRMICGETFVAGRDGDYHAAVRTAAKLAVHLRATTAGPVFIVDVFARRALEVFREAAGDVPLLAIGLYSTNAALERRMTQRHRGFVNVTLAQTLNSLLRAENNDFVVDVSALSPGQTCDAVLGLIKTGEAREGLSL